MRPASRYRSTRMGGMELVEKRGVYIYKHVMMEDQAATGASEPISMVTGGSKPVHRFLKGQPKCIGIVLVMMSICLVMFGITVNKQKETLISADMYTPFWLGTLFFICGLLYILSERNPSKKIITASLALSIISTIGAIFACVDFIKSFVAVDYVDWVHVNENQTVEERSHVQQHYLLGRKEGMYAPIWMGTSMPIYKMEQVFFCHSLIGGILLIAMTFFARAALQSSRTQTVVVMRNLPSAD